MSNLERVMEAHRIISVLPPNLCGVVQNFLCMEMFHTTVVHVVATADTDHLKLTSVSKEMNA